MSKKKKPRKYQIENRKYQIENLRQTKPDFCQWATNAAMDYLALRNDRTKLFPILSTHRRFAVVVVRKGIFKSKCKNIKLIIDPDTGVIPWEKIVDYYDNDDRVWAR